MKPSLAWLGWGLVIAGAIADALYHVPEWFFGVVWDFWMHFVGESGHTVIFVGIVVLMFDVLRRRGCE